MKRYLTFTLLVGFFLWLPHAFADNQRGLSIDAPSQVRHVQNEGNVLLTLRVDNIQVQASWQVTNAVDAFAITNGELSLSVKDEPGVFLATVYVVDEFSRLNSAYANLTASAVITVEILSGEFRLSPVPTRYAIEGRAESLHTLVASEAEATYEIVSGNDDNYFTLGVDNGILSLLATAPVGGYTLSIVASDGSNQAGVGVVVSVVSSLSLSAVPRVTVVVGDVVHTLSASGGIGDKTYTLLAGDDNFAIDAVNGILSLSADADEGLYTLMLGVIDERGNMAQGMATVVVSAALVLAGAPPLMIIASVAMSLHTFKASGGIGVKTYMLAGGGDGYFAIDAINGVLSLSVNTPPKLYKVTVQAIDRRNNIAHAVATVGVSARLTLADASERLFGGVGTTVSLHTFMASGGIGVKTYTLVSGNEDGYFNLGVMSGVLSLTGNATVGLYTLSVQARDSRGHLALAVATVEVLSLYLANPSQLYAIEGRATNLYTLMAEGGSEGNEYTIIAGNEGGYFAVDVTSGVLSVLSSVTMGVYSLSVAVSDNEDNRATALVVVEVVLSLSLLAVPRLDAVAGEAANLYTLAADGGIGDKTYTLVAGNSDYFLLAETSGVLSVAATAGLYTLTLGVIDERGNMAQEVATVAVSAALVLVEVPPLSVALGAVIEVYTVTASGGIGVKTYTLLAGGDDYFVLGSLSGVLSLSAVAPVGIYTLSLQATDSHGYDTQALVTVAVLSLYLADASLRLSAIVGRDEALYTFAAVDAIGAKTYTLLVGNADYFSIDTDSGVLSVWSSATVGIYTLSVGVSDRANSREDASAVVEVVSSLSLLVVPRLEAVDGEDGHLYTLVADGGIGAKTYTLIAGNKDYFVLLDDRVLSVSAVAGLYTLTLGVADSRHNTAQVLVTVGISAMLMLSDAPRLTVIASVAMSLHTFMASGGIGDKTYTLVLGEDSYFTVHEMSGVLSLAVGIAAGLYTVTVRAIDADGRMVDGLATVGVSAALSLADAPLISVALSATKNLHTFVGMGGIGRKTYTLLAGKDTHYFNLGSASGVLSLTGSAPVGSYTLSVQAMDAENHMVQALATVAVLSFYLESPPKLYAIEGRAVDLYTLTVFGGAGDKTYMLSAGNTDYFSIGRASGVLSVLSSVTVGSYTLWVAVSDGSSDTGAQAVVEVVSSLSLLVLSPLTLVAGEVAYTVVASGGIGAKTYTLVAGEGQYFVVNMFGLLSLSSEVRADLYTLTLGAIDSRGNTAEALATVVVSAALTLADAPRVTVIASVAMSLYTFIASGGIGGKTYTLAAGNEDYFGVGETSGVLSLSVGTPVGLYTLTVWAMDVDHRMAKGLATVGVSAALSLADAPPLSVGLGMTVSLHTFVAMGGIDSKTYTLIANNGAQYFNVGAINGVLSVTGKASVGMYTLSIYAIDSRDHAAVALATVAVLSLYLADALRLSAIVGRDQAVHTLAAVDAIGAKTYTLLVGNADYFSVAMTSGVLSVLSSATVGVYTLSLGVSDRMNNKNVALAVVEVVSSLSLSAVPRLTLVAGEAVYTISASGGIGAKTYTVVAGEEQYFVVNMSSGLLSLSSELDADLYTLTLGAIDARGNTAQALATVVVSAAVALPDTSLTAIASVAMSLHTFMASGGIGGKTYTLVGDDEDYFGLGVTSGVLSLSVGITVGLYTLTVIAVDEEARAVSALLVVGISASLSLADAPSLAVIASVAMSVHMFTANGGIGGKTYILVAGHRDYFGLGEASGVLSLSVGTPKGLYTLTVRVIDARHHTAEALATVGISATLSLADAPQLFYVKGKTVTLHRFTATGGIGHRTYTIVAGQMQYFNLDVTSGVLSSQGDAAVDHYTLSVHVSDRRGHIAQALATVEVLPLFLADATLYAVAGRAEELHTFVAEGGDEDKTYTLIAGREDYFSIGKTGVLSVRAIVAAGLYTVSVRVIDEVGPAMAQAVVEVVLPLSLADVSLVVAMRNLSVGIELYTLSASDGIKAKTYRIVSGGAGYFEMAANGVLSVVAITVGRYTLLVEVRDGDVPPNRVMAMVQVDVRREEIFVSNYNYGDYDGGLWASLDGANWQEASRATIWSGRTYHQMVAHQGRLYLLGGEQEGEDKNDVWSSVDGQEWELVTPAAGWSARRGHQAVSYRGRLYVLGGVVDDQEKNDVWSSVDGQEWLLETSSSAWLARQNHQAVAHHDRLYVLGGQHNDGGTEYLADVWSSDDGENWGLVTLTASWSGRDGHQVVSHNGLLYVLGGGGEEQEKNDVWSSFAGRDWTRVPENAKWSARRLHQAVSYRGRLYVLFGDGDKDVWSSVDGRQWEEEQGGLAEFGSEGFRAAVFPPALRVIGTVERLSITVGISQDNVYTMVADYGSEPYTYELISETEEMGFVVSEQGGVLSFGGNAVAGDHMLTVRVTDRDGVQAHTPLQVTIVPPSLADVQVTVAHGRARISLHQFTPRGGVGTNTYAIIAGDDSKYFNANDGLLAMWGNAPVGNYNLLVQMEDSRGNTAQARALVQVSPSLTVAVPLLRVLGEIPSEVHRFVAANGIGVKTYTLIADRAGYFSLGANGVLSVGAAMLGSYTVSLAVQDSAAIPEQLTVKVSVEVVRNMMFVLGGGINITSSTEIRNDVWSSAEGVHWALEKANNDLGWLGRNRYQAVEHQGQLYVLGGERLDGSFGDDVWSSANGEQWSLVQAAAGWSARRNHQAVSHQGRLYVLGGLRDDGIISNDVWSSVEGGTWREDKVHNNNVGWPGRYYYQAVSHNGRLYVLGGSTGINLSDFQNDVWSSVDGKIWMSVRANADWSPRHGHQAVSHNGRLYVLGGYEIENQLRARKNDVWSSVDGKSWSLEKANADWSPRHGHQALSYQGRLYVLGGSGDTAVYYNDVWSSPDGKSWELERANNDAVNLWARYLHQAVVFPPSLLIAGVGERLPVAVGVPTELHMFAAQYGDGNYTYSLSPEGLGFELNNNGNNAVLSANTNTKAGSYTLTVLVTDGEGGAAQTAVWVDVMSIVLADVELTIITGQAMSVYTFMALGGTAAKTYTIVAGNDEQYFSLEEGGVLSVSAGVSPGRYTLSVQVIAGVNRDLAKAVVSVVLSLSWSDVPPLFALTGVAKDLYTVMADDGIGVKTYSLVVESDDFTLSPEGVLSVLGSATVGVYTLPVAVVDRDNYRASGEITVAIRPSLSLTVPLLFVITAEAGDFYTLSASGGFGDKNYMLVAGNNQFTVARDGVLSWSGDASLGRYTLSLAVRDDSGRADTVVLVDVELTLSLAAVYVAAIAELPDEVHTFVPIGGSGAKTYQLVAGQGGYFDLDAVRGVLSVQAAEIGAYTLSVMVQDEDVPPRQVTAKVVVSVVRNQIFVMAGNGGSPPGTNLSPFVDDVWFSADGKNWAKRTSGSWPVRELSQVVAHQGRMYVLGGRSSYNATSDKFPLRDVWSSETGKNWRLEEPPSWSARYGHQGVLHQGRIYVLGGGSDNNNDGLSDVWSSGDGATWRLETNTAPWGPRIYHQVVSHNGRLYLLSGAAKADRNDRKTDVWSSVDGRTWRREVAVVPWADSGSTTGRTRHRAVSHRGSLYIMGGHGVQDIWSSRDGKNWLRRTDDTPWGLRQSSSLVSYQGLLYMLGGLFSAGRDDVWSSSDGAEWTEVRKRNSKGWRGRYDHNAIVFPPSLFLDGVGESLRVATEVAVPQLHQFVARYGYGDYTYSLSPEITGFNLDNDGVFSTDANVQLGDYTFTVRVRDGEESEAHTVMRVNVSPLVLPNAPLLSVVVGRAVSLHTFTAMSKNPVTYSLDDGPQGFSIDENSGVLSVFAAASVGIYTILVHAEDNANMVEATAIVDVVSSLSLEIPLLFAITGVARELATLAASGGIGAKTYTLVIDVEYVITTTTPQGIEYTYTLDAVGTLYFTLVADGVLSVLPGLDEGVYILPIRVIDEDQITVNALATVRISAAVMLADAPPIAVFASTGLSLHTFTASGGIGDKTYTVLSDGYVLVDEDSGLLYLSSNEGDGFYTVTVQAIDRQNNKAEAVATVEVSAALMLAAEVPRFTVLVSIAKNLHTFETQGGAGAKTYTLVSGARNHFMVGADGILSLPASVPVGVYTLSLVVSDDSGHIATLVVVDVVPPLAWLDGSLLTVVAGDVLSLQMFTRGGFGARTYTLVASNSEDLAIAPNGVLSARAEIAVGIHTLSLVVSDDSGQVSVVAVVDAVAPLSWSETPLVTAAVGGKATLQMVTRDGVGAKTYTLGASNTDYFSLATNGVLSVSGEITVGIYTLSVQVQDERNYMANASVLVQIVSPLSLSSVSSLMAIAKLTMSYTLRVQGGIGPKGYMLVAGHEDGYFAVEPFTGVLSVMNAMVGRYTLSVVLWDRDLPSNRAMATVIVHVVRNMMFVLGGRSGDDYVSDVWSSVDGQNWLRQPDAGWSGRASKMAVHNGRLYVLGGYVPSNDNNRSNDVWSSVDGQSWSLELANGHEYWSPRSDHQVVSHHGRLYVLGGQSDGGWQNDVWSSVDGREWLRATMDASWPRRLGHQAVSHNGRLYVLGGGGLRNDVWSSVDGDSWEQVNSTVTVYPGRVYHQVVSHQGLLYVLGGRVAGGNFQNDVWSSSDGRNWTQEIGVTVWSEREWHQSLVYQDQLYVLGGFIGGSNAALKIYPDVNDVWSSVDGKNWVSVTANWPARHRFVAGVFPPALFLVGVGEQLHVVAGSPNSEIHTFKAQYGDGQYTYSLVPEVAGFVLSKDGVLSAADGVEPKDYTLTIQVEDGERTQAQTTVQVRVSAMSSEDTTR